MPWEQPDDRHGRTAVLLLVAAMLVAAALAIALVAGAASQSSQPSGAVIVRGARVTAGTSAVTTVSVPAIRLEATVHEGVAANVLDLGPGHWPGTAAPGA